MRPHLAFAMLGFAVLGPQALAQDASALQVNRVEAFLVSGQTGKLSANIIDPKQPMTLWNTIIGEGDAGEPANDVLVVVHVQKPPQEAELPTLSLKAMSRTDQTMLGERKDVYVPFLDQNLGTAVMMLHDVTCIDLDIQVLIADKIIHTAQIPFACGE
jgi:hypothetical protein